MIRILAGALFMIENNSIMLNKMKPEIEKFINYPYVSAGLKYDIQNKIGKAIINEMIEINQFRRKLEEETDCKEGGKETEAKILELLNSEVELECAPVSLTKLLLEECSGLNFAILDRFILDDRK